MWINLDIQNGHIGLVLLNESTGDGPVVCLSNDLNIGGMFQKLANPRPNHGVIIG